MQFSLHTPVTYSPEQTTYETPSVCSVRSTRDVRFDTRTEVTYLLIVLAPNFFRKQIFHVGFQVLSALVMTSYIVCDIRPCSSLKII
jgi:hypothetical protein